MRRKVRSQRSGRGANSAPSYLYALRVRFVAWSWIAERARPQRTCAPSVGTLRTAAGASARARVGLGLTHPWLADPERRWWEAYLFVGGQTEAVARDLFLDGSTFHRSVHVSREPVVGAWERGVGVRLWRLGLEYRAVSQGREYRTGPAVHPFGGITLSWWLAR